VREIRAPVPHRSLLHKMTLLLTSDLNGQFRWYEWLAGAANRVDAICVAGDLINPFRGEIRSQREMAEFAAWRLGGSRVGFFACEGDQDLWGSRWHWLKSLAGTRRNGEVAVTSVPWKCEDPAWFENPRRWSKEASGCWLVLEHEPPPGTAVAAGAATELLEDSLAMKFAPDFLLSGHMRCAPWLREGSWWDRRGRTFVFNAGFDPESAFPCHILLDTARREAIWKHADGYERIRLDAFSSPFPSTHPSKP
jgi:hypothetical protein